MKHAHPITDVQYVEREGVELVELRFNDERRERDFGRELLSIRTFNCYRVAQGEVGHQEATITVDVSCLLFVKYLVTPSLVSNRVRHFSVQKANALCFGLCLKTNDLISH